MSEESNVSPAEMMENFFGEPEGPAESLDDFPDEIREDVEGLIWLGYLTDSFEIYGHHFVIRTLRGDEELLASLICKEWVETLGQTRAWAWAQIALSLESVDNDEDFCPPAGPDRRAYARARFHYVTSRWYWPVAEKIFEKYLELQKRQLEALERLEDLSQGSLPTFTPSVGSSTSRASSSEAEGQEDIREFLDQPDSPESSNDS